MRNITIEQRSGRDRRPLVPAAPPIDWSRVAQDRWGIAAAAYLLCCLLLGGATASGAVANGLLQMLAIGLLLWLALTPRRTAPDTIQRTLLWLAFAAVAVPLVQLVPLPPALWTMLPGREAVARGYALLDLPLPWLPISLVPERTIVALLSLLPPLALLLLALRSSADARLALAVVIVTVALLSWLLGIAQLSGGSASPLYFYSPTTARMPVGLFANVNHHATLILAALPLLALLVARVRGNGGGPRRLGPTLLLIAGAVPLVVSLALTRSLAGALMAGPVLLGAALVALSAWPRSMARWHRLLLGAIGVLALVATVLIGLTLAGGIGGALGDPADPVSRPQMFAATIGVAWTYFPWGGGLGSFDQLYPIALPIEAVSRNFINHAHNDYAELLLDAGLLGYLVLLPALAWIGWHGWPAMRTVALADAPRRAGSVVLAVVLAHSLVDYPARTAAIMAVVAVALAMLAAPVRDEGAAR